MNGKVLNRSFYKITVISSYWCTCQAYRVLHPCVFDDLTSNPSRQVAGTLTVPSIMSKLCVHNVPSKSLTYAPPQRPTYHIDLPSCSSENEHLALNSACPRNKL
jgi:hypothetical protein